MLVVVGGAAAVCLVAATAILAALYARARAALRACNGRTCLECKCPLSSRLGRHVVEAHGPLAATAARKGPLVATMAFREGSTRELLLLARSLDRWEPDARLYVLTDDPARALKAAPRAVAVASRDVTARYRDAANMLAMDALPGGEECATMRTRFMYEKASILEHVFEREPEDARAGGVWFVDSDVVLLAALPRPPSDAARLGVSLNTTIPLVDDLDGCFNGGLFWVRDPALLHRWRELGTSTTFYEQQTLEPLAAALPSDAVWVLNEGANVAGWRLGASVVLGAREPRPGEPLFAGFTLWDKPVLSLHHHFLAHNRQNFLHFELALDHLVRRHADRLEGIRWFRDTIADARREAAAF